MGVCFIFDAFCCFGFFFCYFSWKCWFDFLFLLPCLLINVLRFYGNEVLEIKISKFSVSYQLWEKWSFNFLFITLFPRVDWVSVIWSFGFSIIVLITVIIFIFFVREWFVIWKCRCIFRDWLYQCVCEREMSFCFFNTKKNNIKMVHLMRTN